MKMKKGKFDYYNHFNSFDEKIIRRIHDRQIQDRIRQITNTMLKRRLQVQSNVSEEKRQIKLELLEVKKTPFKSFHHLFFFFS
jgi:hypothetical protein